MNHYSLFDITSHPPHPFPVIRISVPELSILRSDIINHLSPLPSPQNLPQLYLPAVVISYFPCSFLPCTIPPPQCNTVSIHLLPSFRNEFLIQHDECGLFVSYYYFRMKSGLL